MESEFVPAQLGHVSRARLLGPGSALARRLEQQAAATAAAAASAKGGGDGGAAQPGSDQLYGDTQHAADHEAEKEEDEPPQLSWPELWDARLLAGHLAGRDASAAAAAGPRSAAAAAAAAAHRRRLARDWLPSKLLSHRQRYKKGPRRAAQRSAVDVLVQYSRQLSAAALERRLSGSPAPAPAASAGGLDALIGAARGGGGGRGARGDGRKRPRSRGPEPVVEIPPAPKRAASEGAVVGACGGAQEQQGSPAAQGGWVCFNRIRFVEPEGGYAVCSIPNHRLDAACSGCGALRWDGPDGQLAARTAAAMQTADLDHTTGRQVRGWRSNLVKGLGC
jgi:hypothetical protein